MAVQFSDLARLNTQTSSLLLAIDGIDISEQRAIIGFNRVPPDHNGAVGEAHVVSVLNHVMQIYDKAGTLLSTQTLDSLFGSLSGGTVLPVDPNILYDAHSGRFVYVSFEVSGTGGATNTADDRIRLNIAVSKTGDPLDGWYVKTINALTVIDGENTWSDFPGVAVDGEAVYITANMFQFDAGPDNQQSFAGNRVWIIDKGEGTGGFYDGGALDFSVHDPVAEAFDLTGIGVQNGTLMPARIEGALPAESGVFLLAQSGISNGVNELLQVIRIENPLGAPVFTAQSIVLGDISNENLNFLPQAPQPGGPQPISVVDSRILSGGAIQRDGALYAVFSVAPKSGPDAGETTVHWVKLNASNPDAITLDQQGDIGGEDIGASVHTFDASINVNKDGTLLVNFSAAGPGVYAGAYYALRATGDAPGAFGPAETLRAGLDYYYRTRAGENISSQTINRWGDFSSVALDPVDDTTFWFFNQFAEESGDPNAAGQDGRWRVTIGSARATVQNFQYAPGMANEEFYGGPGVDGLQVTAALAGSGLTLTVDGAAALLDFNGGGSGDARTYYVETVLFSGQGGADLFLVSGDLAPTGIMLAQGVIASGGDGADRLDASGLASLHVIDFLGGAGDDTLTGGPAGDILRAGAGADEVAGGGGDDDINGGGGGDVARGGGGDDLISAGGGDDTALGNAGADLIFGDLGEDRLKGDGDNDTLDGGGDADWVSGGDGDDLLIGAAGDDRLEGDAGADTVQGDAGRDLISGGDDADLLFGFGSHDTLVGGAGADDLRGNDGKDLLAGADGDDVARGSIGDDRLFGGGGDDTLLGNDGADSLTGGGGADRLKGDAGDDTLNGRFGDDVVSGGAGDDTFEFRLGHGNDVIDDFVGGAGSEDKILLLAFGAAFDSFAKTIAAATQVGADTIIDFGGGDSITLINVLVGDLDSDDFLFG